MYVVITNRVDRLSMVFALGERCLNVNNVHMGHQIRTWFVRNMGQLSLKRQA